MTTISPKTPEVTQGAVTYRGVRSLYLVSGDRHSDEAVVFLHGDPGLSGDWRDLLGRVGAFARALAPEIRTPRRRLTSFLRDKDINSLPESDQGQLNRYNFSLAHTVREYPPEYCDRLSRALMEAWVWLEREGLLAPRPGSQGEWVFITRRGKQSTTAEDLRRYRRGNLLPRGLLHPRLAQKVWATFLRGDHDTAVFQAFKEVEVRIREAGGFADTDIGVELMRKAFTPEKGSLFDLGAPKAEQEALAHLFAGAIGSYKNPHSHRSIRIEAEEAIEMIMLATHLLGIVDKRASV